MTKTHALEFEILPLFFLSVCLGIFLAFSLHPKQNQKFMISLPVVSNLSFATPTPTTTPTPQVVTTSQLSPDGTKKISLTITPKMTSKNYVFSVSNADGSDSHIIYSANLPLSENMSIPFNTFSPDNTYLFIEHTISSRNEAYVLRADGAPITANTPYFTVAKEFATRETTNMYQEATGWASDILLIVNMTTPNGNKQSYWFEVPDKAIIPLATQF